LVALKGLSFSLSNGQKLNMKAFVQRKNWCTSLDENEDQSESKVAFII
jgi:hypothetical protein